MKIITALKTRMEFNKKDIDDIDWTEYFEGSKGRIEICIEAFKFTGLLNTDLLTSDFADRFKLKRKYKL